jgi:hypothetical protein
MAESKRRMLVREYAELLSGARERWSARAVAVAAHLLRVDGELRIDRQHRLAQEIHTPGMPISFAELTDSQAVDDLESRSWLVGLALDWANRGD